MGQTLHGIDERVPVEVFRTEVKRECGVLTCCRLYSGSLVEIRRFYERFRRRKAAGYHVTPTEFTVLARNSPLEGLDAQKCLERGASKAISMLECMCALATYSVASRDNKILFLMRLFDFDNNRCLSQDEVTILCTNVLNGFAALTGTLRLITAQLETVSNMVFRTADSNPDGLITLRLWVDTVPEISALLSTNEPAYFVPEPDMVFLYMHEADRKEKRIVKGKKVEAGWAVQGKKQMAVTLPSINSARKQPVRHSQGAKPPLVTVRGQAVYHDQVIALKRTFDAVDRNKDGTWSIEEFRARLPQAPTLQRLSESLFRQLDANASGSITFDELVVKTFRGLSQRQLTTVMQWVAAWEAQHYMKLALPQVTRKPPPPSIRTLQEFQTLFHLYDTNKDGMLSLDELKEGLKHMFSPSDIEAMFKKYDENGDHSISLSEFLKLMSPEDTE